MNNMFNARSTRPKHRMKASKSGSCKIISLKNFIIGMIGLMCLSSCYIGLKVLEDEKNIFRSHDLHALKQRQKLNLLNLLNQKHNTISEKKEREKSGKKLEGVKRNVKKNEEEVDEAHLHTDNPFVDRLPMSETPALIGASKAKITCDANVDYLAYWNDPQGTRDINFDSPFIGENPSGKTKYLTFAPDKGGWNNIRMSLEIIFILAAVTGRTLVLPPDSPLYLLRADTKKKQRGFADFFPLQNPELLKIVSIISTEEFIEREGKENGRFPVPTELQFKVEAAKKECLLLKKADNSCFAIYKYLETVGYLPDINNYSCLVFDVNKFNGSNPSDENQKKIEKFCGNARINYFSKELQQQPIIHLRGNEKQFRLLAHFYGIMLFTDTVIDNHYKRFVRDFLHYHDVIFCTAGKIVNALQDMTKERGFSISSSDSGAFSTMHVRRGDLQYKKVKISAEEWYVNLQDVWLDHEIIYIATDEKNKTFFDPIAKHHTLKFLDDFWNSTGLGDLDPNYMGMIETIVASRGRTFSGTYFSTFSGYINRMRGYHGMSMKSSYYGYLPQKYKMHEWESTNQLHRFAYESPVGWIGIDGDTSPNRDSF